MARRMNSPVLVGRDDVVAQLESALDAAISGEPRHAVVGGEAGVGKTRLFAEARTLAEARGARVLHGGCVSVGGEGLPFAPYAEIIGALVAEDGAAQVAALAGRGVPDLARLVPVLRGDESPPDPGLWGQTRLYEALTDLFIRLAQRAPLVIQLDDLHWADPGTLAATSFLFRAIRREPISVVASYRLDDVTRKHPLRPWLAEVTRAGTVEMIELKPLEQIDVAALVRHIVGEDLPRAELDHIQRRADGNPFFVEELLAAHRAAGDFATRSLHEVLLARIDEIPASAQRLLDIAAVGGRMVRHDALVALVGAGVETVDDDLRDLVEAALLVPTPAPDGDDAYIFRHALLQEAVYEAMLPTQRRRLHGAWATALSAREGEHAADAAYLVELAYHWREAHDARALAASIAAGDAAMEAFSYAVAAREFEQALVLWDETATQDGVTIDHVDLLERTSRAAYLASEPRRAVAACREAIEELGDADPVRMTGLRLLLGRTLWVSGDWATSFDEYAEAVRIAPRDSPLLRAQALAGLGQVYMLHARTTEGRRFCEEAVQLARSVGARDLEGHALNSLGVMLCVSGEAEAGIASSEAALEIAIEQSIPDDIGRAHVNLAEVHNHLGHPGRALLASYVGIDAASEWGVARSYGVFIAEGAVQFAFETGAWDEAARLLAEVDRTTGDDDGARVYRAMYVLEFLACSGDPEAASVWEFARSMVSQGPSGDNLGTIYLGGIELAAFEGRFEDAVDIAWEGLRVCLLGEFALRYIELARVAAWPLAEVGRLALAAGDAEEASLAGERMAELVTLARDWLARTGAAGGSLKRVLELNLQQVEAEQERMLGTSTARSWRSVADGWAEVGRPFRVAMARWREAEVAELAGDRKAAITALRQSFAIATELGAKPLLQQLELMARRLRVRPTTTGAADASAERPYGLTAREMEVLTEVAASRTNREIAETLFISESTAGVHVSNILAKLGVSSRSEAARLARSEGLAAD